MHFECNLFFLLQRAYKQYVLECLAEYRVKKMPYAIQPKLFPSGNKKVFNVFIKLFNLLELVHFTQIYIFSTYFCIVVVWKKTSCLVILRWWLQWFGTSRISKTQFHCGSSSWLFWLVYCFWLFSYTSYTEWVLLWYKRIIACFWSERSINVILSVLIYVSCISEMVFFLLAVGLLQTIWPLRHCHGESGTQTAGCLWGLKDHQSYQNHSTWPYDCNGELWWNM